MRRALIIIALGLSACGGNPAAPTAQPPPATVNLAPGRYSLTLGNRASSSGLSACVSIGTNPAGVIPTTSITVAAQAVSDDVGGLVVRAENDADLGLLLKVRQSGSGVTGTLHGSAKDTQTQQTVMIDGGADSTAATVSGSPLTTTSVGGQIAGRVVFGRDGAWKSCNENDWSLMRLQ
jgi:hypothetical protein